MNMNRFALNRIIAPSLGIKAFYGLAVSLGMRKVELRNDIRDGAIIDELSSSAALRLAKDHGIEVLTINALQKFNLGAMRSSVKAELDRLADLAAAIECKAIVFCPNNDPADLRSPETRIAETTEALQALAPALDSRGLLGYVEPLGFGISSLSSIVTAQKAIRNSGHDCYRILIDTFHHYLGPDSPSVLGKDYEVGLTGLVHISSVEADIPKEKCLDEHRGLPSPADRMESKEQLRRLLALGYEGDVALEPFGSEVRRMSQDALVAAVRKSLDYLADV